MANTARAVTVIPPSKERFSQRSILQPQKRRVAAYARVSTDSEEQRTSYEAQVDYYTQYIQNNNAWQFVKVYTDEGITATNTRHRDGFKEMIADALAGRIDLIVTKSVSRFARNTVDSLVTVRKLKEKGVEVYFEKENIYTLDSKGELLITIMSSLAQEESRSISENVTWGKRKQFADGKVSFAYSRFLGYDRGEDGIPCINEAEAKTVVRIYRLFMQGKTACGIARMLTSEGVPTPAGKEKWQTGTVESILTNEKYKGAALLQKKFTTDFLQKKMKVNEGEVPQYYVENSHDPIIPPDEWQSVQNEIQRRKALGKKYTGNSIFACKVVCGDCGEFFGSKVWHSTDKYRSVVWQCNAKFKNEKRCRTPHLTEEVIKSRFVAAFNTLLTRREMLLDQCRLMQTALSDNSATDGKIAELQQELDIVGELIRKCIDENSRTVQNQQEYTSRYDGLVERYERIQKRLADLTDTRARNNATADAVGAFMFELSEREMPIDEFNDRLWTSVIDHVTVYSDDRMQFAFKGGILIEG